MAIDIDLWWLSSLSFLIVFNSLGPKIVAIAYMVFDRHGPLACSEKDSFDFLFHSSKIFYFLSASLESS